MGIATGAASGMGLACARRLLDMVDHLLLVDRDEASLGAVAADLAATGGAATMESVVADVTGRTQLDALAGRVGEMGSLRAVAHAAGVSPTMADWRRIFTVDLVGTALLAEVLRPLATAGTAMVFFASMAPLLAFEAPDPAIDAVLDDPLDGNFLDHILQAVGPSVDDTGTAYAWAKRGVQRFAQREAVRLGPIGARVCSVSPGIIDTPMGRQEAADHAYMQTLVEMTPLRREGRADEVAAAVAWALSDEASFLTGTDLVVDGGVCAAIRGPRRAASEI